MKSERDHLSVQVHRQQTLSTNADTERMSRFVDKEWQMAGIRTARQLGAAVRARREQAAITQSRLAEASGVSRAWLAKFEAGHRAASVEQILKVLDALNLDIVLNDRPEASPVDAEIAAALAARRERP